MTSVDSQQSSDVFRLMLYHDLTMNSYAEFGVLLCFCFLLFVFCIEWIATFTEQQL